MSDTHAILEIEQIVSGYDGIPIIKDLQFCVGNETLVILGANGAGKTTLLATLARHINLMSGSIRFSGRDASRLRPYEVAELGIGYVPQENGVFPDLTIAENLLVGGMLSRRSHDDAREEVLTYFPDLRDKLSLRAGSLSGGESRMVSCGRALMSEPTLLLLDEPTAGLSPLYVDLFFDAIAEIRRRRQLAIVVAEQNASKAISVADRVMILNLGRAESVLPAADLTVDQLKRAYHI